MSAIGGFFATTPPGNAEAVLAALADGLAERGPDGCRGVTDGAVGMVYRPFHTTPGSLREEQPVHASDGVLLTLDGRLDGERDDGAAETAAGHTNGRGDAARVLAAYRRWGTGFADRLTGDFAASVWDPRHRRLILACDPFGVRPLFYAGGAGGLLLWASNVTALLRAGVTSRLDERWIAGFLGSLPPEDRTVYEAIHCVPPGHLLIAGDDGHRLHRYWPGDSLRDVRCADDREYEARFASLLRDAVRQRLRATGPVFAELSGGVDSSSIVCLAEEILRQETPPAPGLHTCSFVFDEATSGDEREFIRPVEERTGRPSHWVSDREAPMLDGFLAARTEVPTRLSTFAARYRAVSRHMRCAGARVVLSGIAGDDLGLSEIDVPLHLADLAAAGSLGELLRETRRWSDRLDLPVISLAWSGIVLPFLPAALQGWLTARDWQHIPWVREDFARRTRLRRRLGAALPGEAENAIRRPSLRRRTAGLRATVTMQVQPRYLDDQVLGREMRYPYLHRPLVEYCLGLPIEQLIRPGETRSIHRRALAPSLPPQVARRATKQGPEEAMIRAVGRQWRSLEEIFSADACIYQAGFVEKAPFLRALNDFRFGMLATSGPVFRALELETWLRQDE